jgi:hypothetical protein
MKEVEKMFDKLNKTVKVMLIMLFSITQVFTHTVAAAEITAQNLVGEWDVRLKVNKPELFGALKKQRNQLHEQKKIV